MTATVLPFIARKPSRTEAERACQQRFKSMTMRLLWEQMVQKAYDEAVAQRELDEARKAALKERV